MSKKKAVKFKKLTGADVKTLDRECSPKWRGRCSGAAEKLRGAFDWSASPEGGDFWCAIYLRLDEMSRSK